MPITDHLYEDAPDGLCQAVVITEGQHEVSGRICDQPPEEHERPAIDRKGTCHLVGCVGKGIHGPEGPHSKPSDPPVYPSQLRSPYHRTVIREKIGAPDSWAPYEGGPTIPQPHSYCLGFAQLVVDTRTNVSLVRCSIAGDQAWGLLMTSGTFNMSTLVDAHKRDCPNRVVR